MDQHLEDCHQKEISGRKNRQSIKKDRKGAGHLTVSKTLSIKSEENKEYFAGRSDIVTSQLNLPLQLGGNTLLNDPSLQSLPDSKKIVSVEIIFCSLCNVKLFSGAEFESHMKSCHSIPEGNEIIPSAISNETVHQNMPKQCEWKQGSLASESIHPTQNFEFGSVMSGDLGSEVYPSVKEEENISVNVFPIKMTSGTHSKSNNQQYEDALQVTDKSIKAKKQLKTPTIPCKYCGKILTDKYMKTHYLKVHKEIYKSLDTNSNQESSSLESKNNNSAIQSVSTLLQEDIACLSPSDALNIGGRFGIVAPEHVSPSDSSIKTENNALSKSKSKFKNINKSLQLTLKESASFKGSKSKDTSDSDQSKNHLCHICFRKYTTRLFLSRHLLNFHKITTNTSNGNKLNSSTVHQESSLKNHLNSTFSELEQDSKSLVQHNYKLNTTEISSLHESNNVERFVNESSSVGNVESACFDQVSFSDSTSSHSINCSNPNINLYSDGKPDKVANIKKARPKNYKCPMCPKAFSYSKILERHKSKDHSSNLSQEFYNLQKCESTSQISDQQMDNARNSHNLDQLLVEQTLEHHESATHKNESFFNLPIKIENTQNNNSYSSSNPSDKVSLSKSDSFFHSSVCSSDDFIFEKNFCENAEKKDGGSYSKHDSIETFNVHPSASSMQFPSSYSAYSKNTAQNSNEQGDINNAQINFNENDNVPCKSTLFTEMLRDSVDTSLPYQTSSCNSTMQSLPHAVYQQSTINLEASSVSTESNECPVCFKKMSTQDQLRHHIEKLHPTPSTLESTVQEDDKQFDSKFNSMFTELQQAYSVINSTESCENMPSKVEEDNLSLSYQRKDVQEFSSFSSGMIKSASTGEEEIQKQEQILTEFYNNFGNSTDPSSFKSSQQDEQSSSELSKRLYPSSTIPRTDALEEQFKNTNEQKESSIIGGSSVALSAGQDVNNSEPILLTNNSSALKHAWMFSDLLEEFEAQTGPTSVRSKADDEKCEELSLKNDVNIQGNFQANTILNSSLMDNYVTSQSEILSEQDTLKESSSKLDSEINNDVNFASGNDFLSKGSHSVSMNDIFSDKFLGAQSDFISNQTIPTNEQGEANDHLFSNDLEYASCGFENPNRCEVEAEKMGRLFESEEIAKQISFLLNSGNESPNQDLMNIAAAVSSGNDNYLSSAEETSFLNHTADQGILLPESENPPTELSCTKPQSIASKKQNSQSKKIYTCKICSKELSLASSLTRHMKSVHQGIPKGTKTAHKNSSQLNVDILDIKKEPGIPSSSVSNENNIKPNSDNNTTGSENLKNSNMVFLMTTSDKTNNTCKIVSQTSMKLDSVSPNSNIQHKRSGRRSPVKCPICHRVLCSSDSLRRHMRNLHPECPLPKRDSIIKPASTPAPVVQNSRSMAGLQGKRKMDTSCNSSNKQIDKAYVNPNVTLHTFPSSSTNLLSDEVDVAKNIFLNKQKDSLDSKASIDTDCGDFKTNTVSDYVEKTISTIANEIRLESLNKCARNDHKLEGNSQSINTMTNIVPFPSVENKHKVQPMANKNGNLATFQSNSQILLIKCPSAVCFSERPSEISDLTSNRIKIEPFVTPPNSKYEPDENTFGNQAKMDAKLTSSATAVKNSYVNSINVNLPLFVQAISPSKSVPSLSLNKDSQPNTAETYNSKNKTAVDSSPAVIKTEATASSADTSVSSIKIICMPSSQKNTAKKKFEPSNITSINRKTTISKDRVLPNFSKNSAKCQFCHKVFRSFAILSCHLKVIHKVPVLKKPTAAASDTKCADKSSPPNLSQDSSSTSFPSSSGSKESGTKKFGETLGECARNVVGNDENANMELIEVKKEFDNEVNTKSQFHVEDDSIAKRRSRRNDECEIVFEKPGVGSFFSSSSKCPPRKLTCIAQNKYRKYKYRRLIKPKKELSSNQKEPGEVIDIASPVKNSSIPKCVIKVSNDGKYKIDKSPNHIKSGKAKFQFSKRHFSNGIIKVKQRGSFMHKRKLFTSLPTNKRGRRPLKSINLSSIANSKIKKNRMSIMHAAKKCNKTAKKSISRQIGSCVKNSKNLRNFSAETLKNSKEIKRFFLEHKQPIVVLERLPSKFVNTSPYLVDNLPKPLFNIKAKPIVRIKRLNRFSLPNSLSLIKDCFVPVEKLKDSEGVVSLF